MGQASGTTLNVSATVLSRNNCRFTIATPATMAFVPINPAAAADVNASVAWQFRCLGSDNTVGFLITASDGGNHSGGTRRMRMGLTSNYLPYSLSITPSSGNANKGDFVNFTIQGTVLAGDGSIAMAGSYSDTVQVTIVP